jgi:transcriptional regulator with XRE-family HTH domain
MGLDIDTCQLRKILSENIKQQRKILGLTQEKLAESADLSPNMVNDIEGCRTWVSDKTILKLAKSLKIEAYQLLIPAHDTSNDHFYVNKELILRIKQRIDREFDTILK